MCKTYFFENSKFWEAQKRFGDICPRMPPPVSAGLGRTAGRKSSIGGLHVCPGGLNIVKIYF